MWAKVYIWETDKKALAAGHASMTLSNGIHISWWPSSKAGKKSVVGNESIPAKPHQTLNDDISGEDGKLPTEYVLNLTPAQLQAITKWWEEFKATHSDWILMKMNCSTVVYLALKSAYPGLSAEEGGVWTPFRVEQMVQRLGAKQAQRQPQPPGLLPDQFFAM
ncbi:hypothetical protein DPMN_082274 [Dreissena polymorpha]|uniref:Lnb N-terminal periplasmic domain-containing protein n=1 Tax=Dreissena polymorpha TaxID=45954 RepID=A0A9D3Y6N6_DREPO|nr:hypothetical protein DPMN_082274 [Dreissena polymorpha]